MADPVADPVAEHDARYGEEGAGPPEWDQLPGRYEQIIEPHTTLDETVQQILRDTGLDISPR